VTLQFTATVTAGDVTLVDGQATIRTPAGAWTLHPADAGPLLCGGCAILRWLEVLQVAATRVATAEVAGLLKAAPEVTGRSTPCLPDTLRAGVVDAGNTGVVADRPMGARCRSRRHL
jgi:hypothetical protein